MKIKRGKLNLLRGIISRSSLLGLRGCFLAGRGSGWGSSCENVHVNVGNLTRVHGSVLLHHVLQCGHWGSIQIIHESCKLLVVEYSWNSSNISALGLCWHGFTKLGLFRGRFSIFYIHRGLMLSGLLLGVLLGLEFLEFRPDVLGIQGLTIEQFKLT